MNQNRFQIVFMFHFKRNFLFNTTAKILLISDKLKVVKNKNVAYLNSKRIAFFMPISNFILFYLNVKLLIKNFLHDY